MVLRHAFRGVFESDALPAVGSGVGSRHLAFALSRWTLHDTVLKIIDIGIVRWWSGEIYQQRPRPKPKPQPLKREQSSLRHPANQRVWPRLGKHCPFSATSFRSSSRNIPKGRVLAPFLM